MACAGRLLMRATQCCPRTVASDSLLLRKAAILADAGNGKLWDLGRQSARATYRGLPSIVAFTLDQYRTTLKRKKVQVDTLLKSVACLAAILIGMLVVMINTKDPNGDWIGVACGIGLVLAGVAVVLAGVSGSPSDAVVALLLFKSTNADAPKRLFPEGQVPTVLEPLLAARGGWSNFPAPVYYCEGDLFCRSMMGETSAFSLLKDWMARSVHSIDFTGVDPSLVTAIRNNTDLGFDPFAISMGPLPLELAREIDYVIRSTAADGYLGVFLLRVSRADLARDPGLHIPCKGAIQAGAFREMS